MTSSTRKTTLGLSLSLAAILLAAPLAGCARPMYIEATISVWCDTNHPEQPTRAQYALYTTEQKVGMADRNEFGAKHCGWKPGG